MIPLESKLTPQQGHKLEHRNKEDHLQNSSSLKLEGIELRFLVCSIIIFVDLCQFHSYDALGIKMGPDPRVTSCNQRNKDVEFICGENDSSERSRAIMALLFKEFLSFISSLDKCHTSIFNALISTMFSKSNFSGSLKLRIVW